MPYGVFSGTDAKFVIGVLNDREFIRLAAALGYPGWTDDDASSGNRDRVANSHASAADRCATCCSPARAPNGWPCSD